MTIFHDKEKIGFACRKIFDRGHSVRAQINPTAFCGIPRGSIRWLSGRGGKADRGHIIDACAGAKMAVGAAAYVSLAYEHQTFDLRPRDAGMSGIGAEPILAVRQTEPHETAKGAIARSDEIPNSSHLMLHKTPCTRLPQSASAEPTRRTSSGMGRENKVIPPIRNLKATVCAVQLAVIGTACARSARRGAAPSRRCSTSGSRRRRRAAARRRRDHETPRCGTCRGYRPDSGTGGRTGAP